MKNILISGATGGLGGELVSRCLSHNWSVTALHSPRSSRVEVLKRRGDGASGRLECRAVDLLDFGATRRMAGELADACEWDAFVHLAAPPLVLSPFGKQDEALFEREWRIMAGAAVIFTQALVPGMRRRKRGHLLYCLSAATQGVPPKGFAAYTSAKYALLGFVRTVAVECEGSGLFVAAVSPGPMDTELLRDLPAVAKSQMCAGLPGGRFVETGAAASSLEQLIESADASFYGRNLAVPFSG
ncbi:MAG: SDR family oxidoreductase [Verrucomicrobiae bacterium]|nr:SDR family oxidoreductase [Verrucomicrobiae bacterium]